MLLESLVFAPGFFSSGVCIVHFALLLSLRS